MIGPFIDYEENSILLPDSGFDSRGAFNPMVVKEGNDYFILYRAESLIKDGNCWLLYYGAADRACCLAIWEESAF